MVITLYNNSNDKRTVNKNLTGAVQFSNVVLKDDTDMVNPTFILSGLQNDSTMRNLNYLHCPLYDRYYFIENIKWCRGKIVELQCHVDVLESFKTQLLNKTCYVTRQENAGEEKNYFYDGKHPIRSDVTVYPLTIGPVGAGVGYYLTVNGGFI